MAAEIDSSMQAPETGRVTVAHAVRGELDADERPRVVRRSLLCCALGLAIFCLFSLRVPVSSEVRYIESAREMVESGDWTVPHLAYVPYAEKPILLAWTSALSRLIAGDSRVAVRLPSILAATASLLVTFLVGLRLGGIRLATRGALVLLGSSYFLLLGTVLTTDTLFSFWLWAAWYCNWEQLQRPRRAWPWAFWTCVSLGFMTKGPLSLILVLGSIGVFHIVETPLDRSAGRSMRAWASRVAQGVRSTWKAIHPGLGALVFLAINLPWTILVSRRDLRLLEFFYVRENFRAFFNGSIHHRQNLGFYPEVIFISFVPWSIPALAALAAALYAQTVGRIRGREPSDASRPAQRLRVYLAVVVCFTLLFLESSSAKLATYILPVLPAMTLLCVDQWSLVEARRPAWLRWGLLATALALSAGAGVYLAVGGAKVEEVFAAIEPAFRSVTIGALVATAVGLLIGGILVARGRLWRGLAVSGVTFTAFCAFVSLSLPDLRVGLNASAIAQIVSQREQPGDLIITNSDFVQDYSIQLALHHRISYVGNTHELGMGHFVEVTPPSEPVPIEPYDINGENLPANPWLYSHARLAERWRSGRRVWLICHPEDLEALLQRAGPAYLIAQDGKVHLYSNLDERRE